ncbi:hypothetical protein pb186bvf_000034 [Paramecium bursaria]
MGLCNQKEHHDNEVQNRDRMNTQEKQQLYSKMAEAAERRQLQQNMRGLQPTKQEEVQIQVQFQGSGKEIGGQQSDNINEQMAYAAEQRFIKQQNRGIKS